MDWREALWYIIPAVTILLFVVPILIEINVSINPTQNIGVVSVYVLKLKLVCFIVSVHKSFIKIENEKETKVKQIQFGGQEFVTLKRFFKSMADKIKLKKFQVFYNLGLGDAFQNAMFCGCLNQILNFVFVYVKSKKPTASIEIYDNVSYNNFVTEFVFKGVLSVSIFDLVSSFVYAFLANIKQHKVYYET